MIRKRYQLVKALAHTAGTYEPKPWLALRIQDS